MKKIIITISCLLLSVGLFAQSTLSENQSFVDKMKSNIKMWRYSNFSGDIIEWGRVPVEYLGVTTSIGAQYDVLKLGLGTGVYFAGIDTNVVEDIYSWGDYAIPFFAIAQIDLYQSKFFTPYVEMRGGLELYTRSWNLSTSFRIGVGIEVYGFSVGIGQVYQKFGNQVMAREAILSLGYSF